MAVALAGCWSGIPVHRQGRRSRPHTLLVVQLRSWTQRDSRAITFNSRYLLDFLGVVGACDLTTLQLPRIPSQRGCSGRRVQASVRRHADEDLATSQPIRELQFANYKAACLKFPAETGGPGAWFARTGPHRKSSRRACRIRRFGPLFSSAGVSQ
jgi:hypothetical protein